MIEPLLIEIERGDRSAADRLWLEDTTTALEVSPRTVEGDWRFARAWLRKRLSADAGLGEAFA